MIRGGNVGCPVGAERWSRRLVSSSDHSWPPKCVILAPTCEKETLPGLTNIQSVHVCACSVRVGLFFRMSALDIDLLDLCSALVIPGTLGGHLDDARSHFFEYVGLLGRS